MNWNLYFCKHEFNSLYIKLPLRKDREVQEKDYNLLVNFNIRLAKNS